MAIVYGRKKNLAVESEGSDFTHAKQKQPFILAVGQIDSWQSSGRDLPFDSRIGFADYSDITRELITALNPDIIMSAMLCGSFDCIDLAETLHGVGFIGRYRVIVPHLPNPGIISAEIRSLCPGLDFSLIKSEGELTGRLN